MFQKFIPLIQVLLTASGLVARNGIFLNETATEWVLGNSQMEYSISKSDGLIYQILEKNTKQDLCNRSIPVGQVLEQPIGQQVGGLIIFDELRKQEYSDLVQPGQVISSQIQKGNDSIELIIQKRYPQADFTTTSQFRIYADHLRWDVFLTKVSGADRTMRVSFALPLLFSDWNLWAPIANMPFQVQNDESFLINYGQSFGGPIGSMSQRSVIPTTTFFQSGKRAINFTVPFEVPKVMVRFTSNLDRNHFYHFNSRNYSLAERPHFLVINDYLGLKDNLNSHAALLISSHKADWRASLGWVYQKYREYFDPAPAFAASDGVWMNGYETMHRTPPEKVRERMRQAKNNGVKWEELHGHFPFYGLMIPEKNIQKWKFEGKGIDLNRQMIRDHLALFHEYDIKNYIYFNITEAIRDFAFAEFNEDIARDENGELILAFRGEKYPEEKNSCILMNADPEYAFGKHCISQLEKMVETYPQIDGIFFDVYGRTYCFDFAHHDGLTMVNNKPVYLPLFMYQRMMEIISPYLHQRGLAITCNKPTMVESCKGIDGIMMRETNPEEVDPPWLIAQSFLGLKRHLLIATHDVGAGRESLYLNCLRFGAFYTDMSYDFPVNGKPLNEEEIAESEILRKAYSPFIDDFKGKSWVFYPQALKLPENTRGNIFRLPDGRIMITMISTERSMFEKDNFQHNLEIEVHLPDLKKVKQVSLLSPDYKQKYTPEMKFISGDGCILILPKHRTASIIYFNY